MSKATGAYRTWRSPETTVDYRRVVRNYLRLLLTLAAIALTLFLGYYLWLPFLDPRVFMVSLSISDYEVLSVPPLPYAAEDRSDFDPLSDVLRADPQVEGGGVRQLRNIQTASSLSTLSSELQDVADRGSDILVFYLRVQGISENGEAYLLGSDFDPLNPTAGRYRLRDVLEQVQQSPAEVKLLLLDAGTVAHECKLGMVVNEFSYLLKQEMRTLPAGLWVMTSHSPLERSHSFSPWRRSLFGYFLSQGLLGGADMNASGRIDLDELFRFTSANVSAAAKYITGGTSTQTPMLLASGNTISAYPTEIALLPVQEANLLDAAQYIDQPGVEEAAGKAKLPTKVPKLPKQLPTKVPGTSQLEMGPHPKDILLANSWERESNHAWSQRAIWADGVQLSVRWLGMLALFQTNGNTAPPTASPPAPSPSAGAPPAAPTSPPATDTPPQKEAPATTGETISSTATNIDPEGKGNTTPDGGAAAAPKRSSSSTMALVADAWRLRDQIAQRKMPGGSMPVDYAPQYWKEYQELLLGYEYRLRSGRDFNSLAVADALRSNILPLQDLLQEPPQDVKQNELTVAQWISQSRPKFLPQLNKPHSLAFAEILVWPPGSPTLEQYKQRAKELDDWAVAASREGFDEWAKGIPPNQLGLSELFFAKQLSDAGDSLAWELVQRALENRITAEEVAARGVWCTPWVQEKVVEADRYRVASERELLRKVGSDTDTASKLQIRARQIYRSALSDVALVEQARQLRADLTYCAPYYVKWYANAGLEPGAEAPNPLYVLDLIKGLRSLHDLLDLTVGPQTSSSTEDSASGTPTSLTLPQRLSELQTLTNSLVTLRGEIEKALQEDYIRTITERTARGGNAWKVEVLLSTPLPDADARIRLLSRLLGATAFFPTKFLRPSPEAIPYWGKVLEYSDWKKAAILARLQVEIVQLAGESGTGKQTISEVRESYLKITQALQEMQIRPDSAASEVRPAEDKLWVAFRNFGAAIARYNAELPMRVETEIERNRNLSNEETRRDRMEAMQQVWRPFLLVDSIYARDLERVRPAEHLRNAHLYDLLLWHQDRFLRARREGAGESEAQFLVQSARDYVIEAADLPNQPKPKIQAEQQLPIELRGSTTAQLSQESWKEVELFINPLVRRVQEAWVILEYDPKKIEVRSAAGDLLYHRPRLTADPDTLSEPPSYRLQPDTSQRVRLEVRSLVRQDASVPLVFQVKVGGVPYLYSVQMEMPKPDVAEIQLADASFYWSRTNQGIVVYPYPNQSSTFTFELKNLTEKPGEVKVEAWALPLRNATDGPQIVWPFDDEGDLMDGVPPLTKLTEIPLVSLPPRGGTVPIAFAGLGLDTPDPNAPKPENPPEPLKKVMVSQGMVFVITDLERDRKITQRVDLSPQRPRRYLQPQVSYNNRAGRIEIRAEITGSDRDLVPKDGISLAWNPEGQLPTGAITQLTGTIKDPDYKTYLFAEVPPDPRKVVTVQLEVDGYPRAFTYQVRCGATQLNIPPENDLRRLQLVTPKDGAAYQAPRDTIPVQLQVDAPIDAFRRDSDYLAVGLDTIRDRQLDPSRETVWRYYADRQVSVEVNEANPDGTMVFTTKVEDYQFDFPAPPLRNARTAMLAEMIINSQRTVTPSHEVLLDSAPPNIRISPARAQLGLNFNFEVLVVDQLSGVEQVDVKLDLENTGTMGKLGEDPAVQAASLTGNGIWSVELATKELTLGSYSVLVRATDKVENESDVVSIPMSIQKAPPPAPNRIFGTVRYGRNPASGIKITVEGKEDTVETDGQGTFVLRLEPGKYKITAEGLHANEIRKVDQEVEVPAPPARPVEVTLQLP
ncbi:Hypothetical protein PBC10988_33780 [Planctomycetales bacterium 10988]|nr:Hypothetical protein PBC10988_33780 [Planctomycetales bacterium 10988]